MASVLVRKILPLVMGIGILAVVIAWLAGVFEAKIEPGLEPPPWRTWEGQPIAVVDKIQRTAIQEAVGTLKAAARAQISTRVLATIEEITVRAGDYVQKGDLLIRLDSQDLQARVRQAEEAFKASRASRDRAEADFERAQTLYRDQAVTKSQFDTFQAQWAVARAEYARAKQALTEAKALFSYTVLKAPSAGRIVDRLAQPGDTVSPGQPLLVLYDAASLRLEVPVPETLAMQLEIGKTLPVSINALQQTFTASVDEIVPQAHAPSRSFLVKMALPRTENLYEGLFGRVWLPAGERLHLCVPTAAVQSIGQLTFVEVVHPDKRLERRFVKAGEPCPPEGIELLSGVEAGERVIIFSPEFHSKGNAAE